MRRREAAQRARKIKPQYAEGKLVRVVGARNQTEAEFIQGLLLEEGVPSTLRRTRGFDVPDMLAAGPRDMMVPRPVTRPRATCCCRRSSWGRSHPGTSPWQVRRFCSSPARRGGDRLGRDGAAGLSRPASAASRCNVPRVIGSRLASPTAGCLVALCIALASDARAAIVQAFPVTSGGPHAVVRWAPAAEVAIGARNCAYIGRLAVLTGVFTPVVSTARPTWLQLRRASIR